MNKEKPANSGPSRTVSLFDAICIIVGTIIGAGIFKTAPSIANFAGSYSVMILLWLVGGLLTVIGALCFAELTTRFSNVAGGDYGFLKMAYGKHIGFLFAWATFWIIRPGNMGAMALTFAGYFDEVFGGGPFDDQWRIAFYTILSILVLSCTNLIGLKQGKKIQNVLTVAKVVGIASIILVAFLMPAPNANEGSIANTASPSNSNWLLAMVLVMFSFGGWNDISFIATEIKKPEKNLFRALILGCVLVTTIYVIVNIAFSTSLGFESVAQSKAVATDVIQNSMGRESWFGEKAAKIVAALICISCLGAINGIIITSPRIYFAAGRDYPLFGSLGAWDTKRNQPWIATSVQAVVTIAFCILCFQYKDPFEVIVVSSAPFFWSFLGLAGLSLIVFRRRNSNESQEKKYFQTPLFPLEPLVLATACFAMAYSSLNHMMAMDYWLAFIAVVVTMVIGAILSVLIRFEPSTFHNDDDP